ncbi:MAG: hypothetical protein EOO01_20595, partial [Chitinophagaceae bacterium]
MGKSILFITTNSLATNPRLVKELRACLKAGHRATVISFSFQNWSRPLNDRIFDEFSSLVTFVLLPGDRTAKWQWLSSTIMNFAARFVAKAFPGNVYLATIGLYKRSWLLLNRLRTLRGQFDLVIAHNPGAFVPAFYFASKQKLPLGIDLEDYHPGESSNTKEIRQMEALLKSVGKRASVFTASSQWILDETRKWLPDVSLKTVVIRNVFSRQQQPPFKSLPIEPLRLIWFSQTVGLNRGIQDAILAMNKVTFGCIELTVIGHCQIDTREQLCQLHKSDKHSIRFLEPMQEAELIETCSRHHIGMALEPGFSLNNELALSNKLFTYLLAGNAIVASETKAQKEFIQSHNGVGWSIPIGAV